MAAAEVLITRATEPERVLGWRLEELERAGYDRVTATEIADHTDVDLHLAVSLTRGGCPPGTALRILL